MLTADAILFVPYSDLLLNTTVVTPPTQTLCGEVIGQNGYTNVSLSCAGPGVREFQFKNMIDLCLQHDLLW
jgi:hypothetical protein